jgi:hypothetical protein
MIDMNGSLSQSTRSISGLNTTDGTSNNGLDHGASHEEVLAAKENRSVRRLRVGMGLVLLSAAIAISVLAFKLSLQNESKEFKAFFHDQATRMADTVTINSQTRFSAVKSFALSITSHAKYTNSTWPQVTMPEFERRAGGVSVQAQLMSMITRVNKWEPYSVENQGWFAEALAMQDQMGIRRRYLQQQEGDKNHTVDNIAQNVQDSIPTPYAIPEQSFRVDGSTAVPETGSGPYLPIWQIAPIVPALELVNLNLRSDPGNSTFFIVALLYHTSCA